MIDSRRPGLFKSGLIPVMTSAAVARDAYRALKAGRRSAIVGAFNKLVALSGRFSPRLLSLPIAGAMMSDR